MSGLADTTLAADSANDDGGMDLIAAQYVLGTLTLPARLRFQTLLQQRQDLRSLTYAWERRLTPISQLLPPQPVPAHVLIRIEQKLDLLTANAATPTPATTSDSTNSDSTNSATNNRAFTPPTIPPLTSLPNTKASTSKAATAANDALWKPWAWASSAVAAVLAGVLLFNSTLLKPASNGTVAAVAAAQDVAVLSSTDAKTPSWIVRKQGNQLVLSPLQLAPTPSQNDLELWSIQGNQPPKSLGLVQVVNGTAVITVPDMALLDSATLAISLEPLHGSTTGAPTGEVLYIGQTLS